MIDQLIFDTSSADTIADSHKVLAGILSTDGSTLITDTLSGGKQGLDVYVINADDIEVEVNAEKAEDSAHSSGDIGNYVLTVRQDTLAASTDTDGDYQSFKSDSLGRLYTVAPVSDALLTTIDADTSILSAAVQTEDAAHSSGDTGYMSLAVRNDTLASLVDTDGDYAPLQVDADGALYVNVSEGNDDALANTALAHSAVSVDTTVGGTDLVGTDLANRKYLRIYNNVNRRIFVGNTGVTSANGYPLTPRGELELRAGASIDVHAISAGGTQDVRILELS